MNDQDAIDSFRKMRNEEVLCVNFISPLLSGILSSSRITLGRRPVIIYQGEAKRYAINSGLESALDQNYDGMIRMRSPTEGKTWSHLTTLFHHSEISGCNTTIINLLVSQLSSNLHRGKIDEIAKVVGELHDNVASHAVGRGFSSAQYYPGTNSCEARLEIAVVDAGRGFLHHVKRKETSITTDKEALAWCLKKHNTATDPPQTENNQGSWGDPFTETTHRTGQRDHHLGLGLWLLTELVRSAHGDLWIWSGNSSCKIQRGGEPTFCTHDISWKGVAIEIVFYPDRIPSLDRPQYQSTIEEDLLERELLS